MRCTFQPGEDHKTALTVQSGAPGKVVRSGAGVALLDATVLRAIIHGPKARFFFRRGETADPHRERRQFDAHPPILDRFFKSAVI